MQSRDFTFISDVVAANLAAAMEAPENCSGNVYNVAGGEAYTLLDLLRLLGGIIGVEAVPTHTDPRPGDVRHTRADLSAGAADLGHQPWVSFEAGLRETVRWFASVSDAG